MSEEVAAPSNGADTSAPAQQVQPEAQQASEKPAVSAREAVQRALARVGGDGTNADNRGQPETKSDKPGQTGTAPGTTADNSGQARDATGKFIKPEAQPGDPAAPATTAFELPKVFSRYTKEAQALFQQVPELWRQETERALTETTAGIEKYKGDAEAFGSIRKYHDMAAQSGTTLDKALENYVGMETALRQDPVRGVIAVCQNMGIDPIAIGQALAGLQAPQGQRQGDTPDVAALKNQIAALEDKIGQVGKSFEQTQKQLEDRETQAYLETFRKEHPYFDELRPSMHKMLKTGFVEDLPEAYAQALRLNTEVAAKIEAEKAAKAAPKPDPAQTREKASKSITGSPAAGSNPAGTKGAPPSARDALQSRFAQLGLS